MDKTKRSYSECEADKPFGFMEVKRHGVHVLIDETFYTPGLNLNRDR